MSHQAMSLKKHRRKNPRIYSLKRIKTLPRRRRKYLPILPKGPYRILWHDGQYWRKFSSRRKLKGYLFRVSYTPYGLRRHQAVLRRRKEYARRIAQRLRERTAEHIQRQAEELLQREELRIEREVEHRERVRIRAEIQSREAAKKRKEKAKTKAEARRAEERAAAELREAAKPELEEDFEEEVERAGVKRPLPEIPGRVETEKPGWVPVDDHVNPILAEYDIPAETWTQEKIMVASKQKQFGGQGVPLFAYPDLDFLWVAEMTPDQLNRRTMTNSYIFFIAQLPSQYRDFVINYRLISSPPPRGADQLVEELEEEIDDFDDEEYINVLVGMPVTWSPLGEDQPEDLTIKQFHKWLTAKSSERKGQEIWQSAAERWMEHNNLDEAAPVRLIGFMALELLK